MQKIIRIGTRDSQLALWQANKVRKELEAIGYECVIVPIKTTGDLILNKPIYSLGITGVFTKSLDVALLNEKIDIAVHSMKDVPTVLPEGIMQAAVLKRANYNDILVLKGSEEFFGEKKGMIATGSLRRKAQWLNRYPTHTVTELRGNVNTRLQKLEESDWNGAVFAAAGLERLGLRPAEAVNLSWMTPAPAQGAVMIACLNNNPYIIDACEQINHRDTAICTKIEREFLNLLEGGCSAPIGALAYINEKTEEINFKGVLLNKSGTKKISVSKTAPVNRHRYLAKDCADYVINRGGKELLLDIEKEEKNTHFFSTKKLSETQKNLFHENIAIESSDFIKIRFNRISPKTVKNNIENVIITSKNGIEALLNSFTKDELNFKNVFCVGRRTKKLIESKIDSSVHAERNAEKLAKHLTSATKIKEVTYFCSDIRMDILPTKLAEKNIIVHEIEAYKTMLSPTKISDNYSGILFYSPSTVLSYLEKNETNKIAFCIGESTAKEARKHFEIVKVAKLPSVESVIELANLHYLEATIEH